MMDACAGPRSEGAWARQGTSEVEEVPDIWDVAGLAQRVWRASRVEGVLAADADERGLN